MLWKKYIKDKLLRHLKCSVFFTYIVSASFSDEHWFEPLLCDPQRKLLYCTVPYILHVVPVLLYRLRSTGLAGNKGTEQGIVKTEEQKVVELYRSFWERPFPSKFQKKAGTVQVSMALSENAMHYLPSFDPHTVGCAQQRGLLHQHVRDMGPRVVCS